ncbi:CAX interacting protein 1 [Prunus dulcis]|uniref:CAX interacting protein 1 n=1 Tax=Prunus dulcis TaxID=3755 RepID=A0A4Y1RR38_PRUDU|nr:CAX interacting protein 1 [Prunus dulcis]
MSTLTPELKNTLDKVVTSHKVVLFMKGTRDFPQCGFSNTVVQILKSLNVPFETINILENELLRQGLKEYSSWPTFPQLYVEGEFFGGCDITVGTTGEGNVLLSFADYGKSVVFDLDGEKVFMMRI